MPDNLEDHVAMEFHGLVSDLQRNDVARFEDEQKKLAADRAALRRSTPNQGLSAGELLKKLDGDPEVANRKIQEDLDRIDRDARELATKQKAHSEPLPEGNFPPPPGSA